jgi:uncharacterized protein involved in exopolysaccharide biosynthesis
MKKGAESKFAVKPLSPRDLAVVIFRHKLMILLTFATTAVVALILALYMPDQYESRMKILVKKNRAEAPVTGEKTDTSFDSNEISESQINSEISLLKSRDLLEQVIKNTHLAQSEKNGGESSVQDIETAIYQLEKDLQIALVKKANVIEVSYTSKSPEVAAEVLKQLSELYLDKHIKLHSPPGTFEFFKQQADQYERDLRDAENKYSSFQKKTGVVALNQQKDLILNKFTEADARLNDLNGQIKETEKRIAEIERQLAGTQSRISTTSRVLPNQDSIERFNTMLVDLRNRRTQLLTKYQPDDRLVKEVDEQIRITNEALAKASQTKYNEDATDLNPLRQTLEGELNKARIEQSGRLSLRENLAGQVRLYKEQLDLLKSATTTNDDLSRQVKQTFDNYQLYAQKQEQARISDELDKQKISNVSILESPTVPRVPYKTNRPLTALLGAAMGLLLGLGCAVVAEFFRETVHTPRELEVLTGVPVVATIPLGKAPKSLFSAVADDEEETAEEDDAPQTIENDEEWLDDENYYEIDLNETDSDEKDFSVITPIYQPPPQPVRQAVRRKEIVWNAAQNGGRHPRSRNGERNVFTKLLDVNRRF